MEILVSVDDRGSDGVVLGPKWKRMRWRWMSDREGCVPA